MSGRPGRFGDVRRFDVIDSTNRYLLDQARSGAPDGLVAVADFQQAGRGRLGRTWEAPPGACLLCSVLLRPVLPPDRLFACTAAVALAARQACTVVAGVTPGIKWPNDLVLGDAKLAGVLAESDPGAPGGPPGSQAVVVGIGLNLTWDGPAEAGGTSLRTARAADAAPAGGVDRDRLLDALLDALEPRASVLAAPPALAGLLDELRRACVTLGRRVRVTLPADSFTGTATGLTADGHLEVTADDPAAQPPVRTVAAGDVVHLRPADGG